ncbi:MAG: YegS/Rv2252/BmrU family lipid kinase [Syntrophomonas sp.]|nr:YegS/Rv2252/BmrU family lipid kinase [Syntrophomonas sp.]
MKKLQLIYNPCAGVRAFPHLLDFALDVFRSKGYELHIFRTNRPEDFADFINRADCADLEAVLIAGGDGSVNLAVNALLNSQRDIPLGIIPAGTSNDFARHLGSSMELSEAIKNLSDMRTGVIDVGRVNDRFFINVCSGGFITNIAHSIDPKLKNVFGRMAYYVKGVQKLPRFSSMRLRVTTPEAVLVDDFLLFLVLNGSGAGGFSKVGGPASVIDGKIDFLGIRPMSLNQLLMVFTKILRGEHINDPHVLHFQATTMEIDRLAGDSNNADTDVDGEKGPDYPLQISLLPQRLRIIIPHEPIK